jgi:acyl-CoA dehydrogenase
MHDSIYVTAEHELLRDQVRRFVADEIEPCAAAWEEQGHVPRDRMSPESARGPSARTATS